MIKESRAIGQDQDFITRVRDADIQRVPFSFAFGKKHDLDVRIVHAFENFICAVGLSVGDEHDFEFFGRIIRLMQIGEFVAQARRFVV